MTAKRHWTWICKLCNHPSHRHVLVEPSVIEGAKIMGPWQCQDCECRRERSTEGDSEKVLL